MVKRIVSVVVPVYNEEQNILPVRDNITAAMEGLGSDYEIIFVDDGSTDNTFEQLKDVHKKGNAKVVRLARNLGKTVALKAGFDHAQGSVIITMDGDFQNDASDIPLLLRKLDEGYDVVSGWRHSRRDAFLGKKIPSLISNRFARFLTGVMLHDFGCPLKAYRKAALDSISMYGDVHRYLPALIAPHGYRITEVKVRHYKRKHGKSKYGLARLLKGPLDLIYIKFWSSYSARPLHFFGLLGIGFMLFGSLIAAANIAYHVYKMQSILTNIGPILLLAIFLMVIGVQFIALGFMSEIMVSSYYSIEGKKPYSVREFLK